MLFPLSPRLTCNVHLLVDSCRTYVSHYDRPVGVPFIWGGQAPYPFELLTKSFYTPA